MWWRSTSTLRRPPNGCPESSPKTGFPPARGEVTRTLDPWRTLVYYTYDPHAHTGGDLGLLPQVPGIPRPHQLVEEGEFAAKVGVLGSY